MKKRYLLIASLIVITFATCKHEPIVKIVGNGTLDDSTYTIPTNDSVCFNTQILPIVVASCAQSGCHTTLNNYANIKLNASTILSYASKTTGKVMPPKPQPRMDTASINLIKRWIKEGTLNRICTANVCDTANVKYTTHIAPIMNIYCKGCHNTTNAGGAVNLDNYNSTKTCTTTGKMICTITASGCAIMPKGGPSLSKCDIRKIQIWAATGCPQ